jgi:hypothetical protein
MVNFTPQPLYPLGMGSRYPLDGRLDESERSGEEKEPLPIPEIEPNLPSPWLSHYTY